MTENQRVWAEINLDNIAHNVKKIRSFVPPTAKLMAVVKADAYGHGAVECAKTALCNGADYLGVAIIEEAIKLRQSSISAPILVLGYTPALSLANVINHYLIQTVFNMEMANALSDIAVSLGKTAKIHIKIDTGMSRLGFMPTEASADEIEQINRLPGIDCCGIYTHLADADDLDSDFSAQQFDKFSYLLGLLSAKGLTKLTRHFNNSAGICRFSHMSMDMVRSGILLYGLSPSEEIDISHFDLKPAMSVKSRISSIKSLSAGVSVGYSRSYFTTKATVVATVPVGYADGFSRRLSNKGRVIVNGKFAPIIGNICMDQFMIDVSGIAKVKENTEIILMGGHSGKLVCADELAQIEDVINYEILCKIGKRVPRLYIRDSRPIKLVNL